MSTEVALRYATTCIYGSEGYRDRAFLDTLAKPPVWTIGHGTTRVNGALVHEGMTCTKDEADAWASSDMRDAANYVQSHVDVTLNDWQLGAMTSFCYNIGMGNFFRSSVREALNYGQLRTAANRLLEYDEAGGHVVAGLDTRRARERALFLIGLGDPPETISPAVLLQPSQPALPNPAAGPDISIATDQLNQTELNSLQSHV